MSYIHHDRNNEQMLVPITLVRGGTSRGFYFEGKNVPKPGEGLEQLVLAVHGSPDAMGMDGLGGDTVLQSRAAIIQAGRRRRLHLHPDVPRVPGGDDLQDEMNTGCPRRGVTQ